MPEKPTDTTDFLNKQEKRDEQEKILQEQNPIKIQEKEELPKIDKLKLFFGEPILFDSITLLQPTIGDILHVGEDIFYSTLNVFIQNTTSKRLSLWDCGIDWNKISNFELFTMSVPSINEDALQLFLPGFKRYMTKVEDTPIALLYNKEIDVSIDEELYKKISYYLKTMFSMFPKEEFAKGKTTKEIIIEEERDKLFARMLEDSDELGTSTLLPLVSSYLNHPGTKYKKSELKEVGIFEFMDSIARLQTYESATAMLKGAYSGFVDSSKLDKNQMNFMRDL